MRLEGVSQVLPVPRMESIDRENPDINPNINQERSNGEAKKMSEKEIIGAIEAANKHFITYDRRLEFSIHDKTKEIMVKIIDSQNDEVIREIPSQKILDMIANMMELAGLLVDKRA